MITSDGQVVDHSLTIRITIPSGKFEIREDAPASGIYHITDRTELARDTAARLLAHAFGFVVDAETPITVQRI